MKREILDFPREYWDAIKEIKKEEYLALTKAIFTYFFDGEEKKLSGVPEKYFALIKPYLEKQLKPDFADILSSAINMRSDLVESEGD